MESDKKIKDEWFFGGRVKVIRKLRKIKIVGNLRCSYGQAHKIPINSRRKKYRSFQHYLLESDLCTIVKYADGLLGYPEYVSMRLTLINFFCN